MKLDKNEEIDGFDFFNQSPKVENIIHKGQKLKLEYDSIYFIEIKKSRSGIKAN